MNNSEIRFIIRIRNFADRKIVKKSSRLVNIQDTKCKTLCDFDLTVFTQKYFNKTKAVEIEKSRKIRESLFTFQLSRVKTKTPFILTNFGHQIQN